MVNKMPWFAWYSERQKQLHGYAHYTKKGGVIVDVTTLSRDPEYTPPYEDSIRLGRVTHFGGVQRLNGSRRPHTSRRRGEDWTPYKPNELKYVFDGGSFLSGCRIVE